MGKMEIKKKFTVHCLELLDVGVVIEALPDKARAVRAVAGPLVVALSHAEIWLQRGPRLSAQRPGGS